MKFVTSVFVVATIFAITEAYNIQDFEYLAQSIPQSFTYTQFDSYLPSTDQFSYPFTSIEQSMSVYLGESSAMATAGQSAAAHHVADKNYYKNVGQDLVDCVNNYKAWTAGNYTKYAGDFLSLLTIYDQKVQAGLDIVAGRPECGPSDKEMAKYTLMGNSYTMFDPGYSSISGAISYMYGMCNSYGLSSISSALSQALYDSDPLAAVLLAEKISIDLSSKLMHEQISNIGDTIISITTHMMDAKIANINTAISTTINHAATYQCTGM